MKKEIENGGPAFPCAQDRALGMTLRDYFAAKAMLAYLPIIHSNHASAGCDQGMEAIANAAYGLADAMLKARSA